MARKKRELPRHSTARLVNPADTGASNVGAPEQPAAVASEPIIVLYEASDAETDLKTRFRAVQSGFGNTAAWTALLSAWRGATASFELLFSRVRCQAPAMRPALVRM